MHVRVCVECGEEYRPEIAVCADCGGRLEDRYEEDGRTTVPERPAASGPDPNDEFTERILHELSAPQLVDAADRLIEQGIACRIRLAREQSQRPFAAGDDDAQGRAAPAPGIGYWLCVSAADREQAVVVLGLSTGVRDAASAETGAACPACGEALRSRVVECPQCGLAVGDEPE